MKPCLGAILALCLSLSVNASEPTPLDPQIVTATRTEQQLSKTLAPTLVISREEIELAQASDLAGLLRFYAGFEVDRAGGPGQLAQVRVRGGETDHVLLLIDGVRVNPATNGPALQSIAPETIERVEIVKGPRSSLYGSEGISATINVITRSSTPRATVSLLAGSHGRREATAGLSREFGRGGFALDAQRAQSEGFPTCADSGLDRASDQTTVSGSGHVRAGAVELSARLYDAQGAAEYLNFGCPGGFLAAEQKYHQQTLATTLGAQPTEHWETTLSLSRVLDDLQQQQAPDYARTQRPRLDWTNVFALGAANRLSVGLEYEHERAEALFTGFGTTFVQERRDIGALRVADELNAGRVHGLAAVRALHDSGFGDHLVWNLEAGVDLWRGARIVATGGSGFRAPTFLERSPGFFGNPDLEPETSRSYELGLQQQLSAGQSVDLRVFRTDTRDLITGFPPANIARARSEGIDLAWRLVHGAWRASLTGIAQDPQDRTTGTQLPRRAKRSLGGKLERSFGAHSLGLDLYASSARPDTDFSAFPAQAVTLPGYVLVGLHGALQLDASWRLQASLDNLLDQQYQSAFGYRQAGATATLGLRYAFP